MLRWAEKRHLSWWLVLGNVLLVGAAALLRHASADESDPAGQASSAKKTPPAVAPSSDAPTVEIPAADASAADVPALEAPALEAPALEAPAAPLLRPGVPAGSTPPPTADPVLDELRKLLRDPDSGLDAPSIRVPPPLVPDRASGRDASIAAEAAGRQPPLDQWNRLHRRAASVHALASAAVKLSAEARALAAAGHVDQAQSMIEDITSLQTVIARLTTAD